MNQLLLGASIPFVFLAAWYVGHGCRASLRFLVAAPLLMLAGAIWAVVPDLPRVVGGYNLYFKLAADPRMNIFFFHYTIDQIETDTPLYLAGAFLLALALMTAAWRELARRE